MKIAVLSLLLLLLAVGATAQSGRVTDDPVSTPAAERATKDLYEEAVSYLRTKADEYAKKKIPFSQSLLDQMRIDQRALAARNAALAAGRNSLSPEDHYYIGMMQWIAGNLERTEAELKLFLASPDADAAEAQTARSVLIVTLAKHAELDAAESLFADYSKNEPKKASERARIEGEMAKAYQAAGLVDKMVPHALANYNASKELLTEPATSARGLDEILDAGMLLFEAYRDSGKRDLADSALDDMSETAASFGSTSFYYYAVDQKIKYLIETSRKPAAMAELAAINDRIAKAFPGTQDQAALIRRFKTRALQYKLLGGSAPEFQPMDAWFPGKARSLASLKGKVVLLDFWATWCIPCLEVFPHLKAWQTDLGDKGFEIIGVTRYYGTAYNLPKEKSAELRALKTFRDQQKLNYDIAVSSDIDNSVQFAATALPTAILIDRKGVIRYIESGTNPQRTDDMHRLILKLLAEK